MSCTPRVSRHGPASAELELTEDMLLGLPAGADFASINVLEHPEIREGVKQYS